MNFVFWLGQREHRVSLREQKENRFEVAVDDQNYDVAVEFIGQEEMLLSVNGRIFNVIIHSNSLSHSVFVNGRSFKIERRSALKTLREEKGRQKKREVKITMPGRVVEVLASAGESVAEGQAVLVIEAMKMQNEIKSPQAGRVTRLGFEAGDYVEAGSVLFVVE
jgi:biotin carboxyl carrier protein